MLYKPTPFVTSVWRKINNKACPGNGFPIWFNDSLLTSMQNLIMKRLADDPTWFSEILQDV
eukprot:1990313-Amphidinium_carterae.1